jgi:hypothetical protein
MTPSFRLRVGLYQQQQHELARWQRLRGGGERAYWLEGRPDEARAKVTSGGEGGYRRGIGGVLGDPSSQSLGTAI